LKEASISEAASERARILSDAEKERATESSALHRVILSGEEATKEIVEIIQIVFENVANAAHHTIHTKDGIRQFIFFLLASSLFVFSLVSVREMTMLCFAVLQKLSMTPRIVREYGNLHKFRTKALSIDDATKDIILEPLLEARVKTICMANTKARKRAAPLRNVLLHGPSGTGKSLVAKSIGKATQGLPYALLSGADLAPLGRRGPYELKRLLSWATKHGAVVIIDEAESALGSRLRNTSGRENESQGTFGAIDGGGGESDGATGFARDTLNVLLSMTGGTSGDFMLILTTSNPDYLDEAVINRMDETIRLPLPKEKERKRLLENMFYKTFRFTQSDWKSKLLWFILGRSKLKRGVIPVDPHFEPQKAIENLANDVMTEGCSGRELEKILLAVASAVYASDHCILNEQIWGLVTDSLCEEMKAKWNLLEENRRTTNRDYVRYVMKELNENQNSALAPGW